MSDEELTGDQVYQPDGSEVQDDEGVLDPEDTLEDRGVEVAIDEGWTPPERLVGLNAYKARYSEPDGGETLEQHLAEEVPDVSYDPDRDGDGVGDLPQDGEPVDPEAGDRRAGRLWNGDADPAVPLGAGDDADLWASDEGVSGGAASAEEAAMHVVDDPEEGWQQDEL